MKLIITVQERETNKILYTTTEPIKIHFFEVAINYGERKVHTAKLLADIGWEMYLKDSNDTPIGKLADFLAKLPNIKKFDNLDRYTKLNQFYNWLENGGNYE